MTLADAQAWHTHVLRLWLVARGDEADALLAELDQARAAVNEAFLARARRWRRDEYGYLHPATE